MSQYILLFLLELFVVAPIKHGTVFCKKKKAKKKFKKKQKKFKKKKQKKFASHFLSLALRALSLLTARYNKRKKTL